MFQVRVVATPANNPARISLVSINTRLESTASVTITVHTVDTTITILRLIPAKLCQKCWTDICEKLFFNLVSRVPPRVPSFRSRIQQGDGASDEVSPSSMEPQSVTPKLHHHQCIPSWDVWRGRVLVKLRRYPITQDDGWRMSAT